MLRRDERRLRAVVDDARRRELGRLAGARAGFRGAWRALLTGSESLTIPAALRDQRDAQRGNGDRHTTSKATIHL
jgi:hypothetical protein